jgi:5-methylcytosine-specific restriction endonuclease McrA
MKCTFVGCENKLVKQKRFCSRKCSNLHRWGGTKKTGKETLQTCKFCGKEWITTRSSQSRGYLTCSKECKANAISKAHKGKVVSQESRAKLSKSKTGVPLSDEHRHAISAGSKPENNRFWIDGRSKEKSGKDYNYEFTSCLKTTVKKRDGSVCTSCKHDGSIYALHVHHVDFDKTNNTLDNLITLCNKCHSRLHRSKDV